MWFPRATWSEFGGNLYYSCDQNSSSKGIQTGIFDYSGCPRLRKDQRGYADHPGEQCRGQVNYSPEGFWFANATTLYVADTGDPKAGEHGPLDGGIQKWVYNGSSLGAAVHAAEPNLCRDGTATATAMARRALRR